MALIETWTKTNLNALPEVYETPGYLFSADNQGNLFGTEIYQNGSPATGLTGTVTGYVIREDGGTVIVTGTLSGNKASIILPTSCYTKVGQLNLVIKLVSGSVVTTVAAFSTYVAESTTDTIVDPGHVIPSLDELLAKIDACDTATASANTAAASATTAAKNANTARTNANTAAVAANEAATAATSAAANATSAYNQIKDGVAPLTNSEIDSAISG